MSDNEPTRLAPQKTTPTPTTAPEATRVQPRATTPKQVTVAVAADPHEALTRIAQVVRSNNHESVGFRQAQQMANNALSAHKIILNQRFVLESVLGAGGMGTVYKARDLRKVEAQDTNPYVAVKVLGDNFKNHPDAFITLQREASRSHLLSHPQIVTVHDFDRDGDTIYMTMELLDGQPLDELIKNHNRQPLEKNKALTIIADICNALAHAHSKNIIHSDLKPSNIFCTKNNTKILDFGIARISNPQQSQADFDAGSLGALTPAYASLEMFQNQPPHTSDDVYAVAVIAYELLTGQHPYKGLSAEEAFTAKAKPKRINQLSNAEWKAIEQGLKLTQAERTLTITQFAAELFPAPRVSMVNIIAALLVLSAIVAGIFVWQNQHSVNNVIEETRSKAQACFTAQNYQCAYDNAIALTNLAPQNTQATQLLLQAKEQLNQQKVAALVPEFQKCINQKNPRCAEAVLDQLKNIAPNANEVSNFEHDIAALKQHVNLSNQLTQAKTCFKNNDFDCANRLTAQILTQEPAHAGAQEIASAIASAQTQQQEAAAQQSAQIKKALDAGQQCLARKDYPCAIAQAGKALALEPTNTEASQLLKSAEFAQLQQKQSLALATNVLKKGEECFKRKNYSCAITSSESALEIIPDYAPAQQLKQRAQAAVNALKSKIIIQ